MKGLFHFFSAFTSKKLITLIVLATFGAHVHAQTPLLTADFETDGLNYTIGGTATGSFGRFDSGNETGEGGTNDHTAFQPITGTQGDFYFFADNIGGTAQLNFSSIDLTGFNTLQVSMLMAAPGDTYDNNTDLLQIQYSIAGAPFVTLAQFAGEGNDSNFYSEDADTNGTGDGANRLTAALTENSWTLDISGFPDVSNIVVRIQMSSSAVNEDMVIDNVRLTGLDLEQNSLSPINGSTVGAALSTLIITYPENVVAGSTGTLTLTRTAGGAASKVWDIAVLGAGNAADFGFSLGTVTLDLSNDGITIADGDVFEVDVDAGIFQNSGGSPTAEIVGSSDWSFTIDGAAPTITTVTSVGNPNGVLLGIGDEITFTVDPVGSEPGATIAPTSYNGQSISWSTANGGDTYTATYTVTAGNADQTSALQLTGVIVTDAVGNASTPAATIDVDETIDANVPVISSVTSVGNPNGVLLGIGDEITFTVDPVGSEPGATIAPTSYNGQSISWSTANGGDTYTATYTVTAGNADQTSALQLTGVIVTDAAGNASTPAATIDVDETIDANVPVISSVTSVGNPNGVLLGIGDEITFTVDPVGSEPGATIAPTSYNGQSISWSTANGGDTYTATYTVTAGNADQTSALQLTGVTVTDAAGNASTPAATIDVDETIDANVPVISSVTSVGNPNGVLLGIGDEITFTVDPVGSEPGATIAPTSYNGQSISWSTANGGDTYTATYTVTAGNADQTSALQLTGVIVTDAAGNASTPAATIDVDETIDANAPSVPTNLDLAAVDDSNIDTDNVTSISTDLTISGPAGSTEAGSTVQLLNGGVDIVGATTLAAGDGSWSIDINLTETTHTITATATDAVGNESNQSASLVITVDQTDPTTPSIPDLDNGSDTGISTTDNITNDFTPSFSGSAVGGAANTTIEIYSSIDGLIGSGNANGSGAYSSINTTISTNANNHQIFARSIDLAGNVSPNSSNLSPVNFDNIAPTLASPQYFPNAGISNDNRDVVTVQVSEEITLNGSASPFPAVTINNSNTTDPGFHIEIDGVRENFVTGSGSGIYATAFNNYQNDNVTRPVGDPASTTITSTRLLRFEGSSNTEWDGTENPRLSYVTGGGIVDLAGNEMTTTLDNLSVSGDSDPPEVSGDIVLFPNGTSPETIEITFNEIINLTNGASVTGFSIADLSTATYVSATNTVLLTSSADGVWDLTDVVTYTNGTGNVVDGAANELASITINSTATSDDVNDLVFETIPPGLLTLTLVSNNTPNDLANGGDQVTLTFSTDDGLNTGSISLTNLQSGGSLIADQTHTFSTTGINEYATTFGVAGVDNDGLLSFNLTFNDEAGNAVVSTVTAADITGQNVTIDNTDPIGNVTSNITNNVVRDADNITITVNFVETNGIDTSPAPTINIGGGTIVPTTTMSVGGSNLEWTYLWNVPAGSDGTYPLVIAGFDDAGNALSQTGLSLVTIDNTAAVATFTTLNDGTQTSFQITFNEQLQSSTTSITNIANLLSSLTNDVGGDPSPIDISSVGGSVAWNTSIPSAPVATITIPSTEFSSNDIVRLNFVNNIVLDIAGNGIPSSTNFDGIVTDNTPPELNPDEMSFFSSGGFDFIEFNINEELNLLESGAVTGFFVDGAPITDARYTGKNTTNTITLRAVAGTWNTSSLVTYNTASGGNVFDLAGIELGQITNQSVVPAVAVTMSPGDIAFSYYHSDNEDFAFVLLRDVIAGEQIRFTDNGWTGTSFTLNENYLVWTADENLLAGTEIVMDYNGSSAYNITPGGSSYTGNVLNLSATNGDQILAFQGTTSNPTFIAGVHMDGGDLNATTEWSNLADPDFVSRSLLPTGLSNGTSSVSPAFSGELDNGKYNTTNGTVGSAAAVRALLTSRTNWSTTNTGNNASVSLPTGGLNYTIPPNVLSVSPVDNSLVPADQSLFQITFDENIFKDLAFAGNITISEQGGGVVLTFPISSSKITTSGAIASLAIDATDRASLVNGTTYEIDVDDFIFVNGSGFHNEAIDGTTWRFNYDSDVPEVTSINRTGGVNPTFATSVDFTVTFDQPVSGVDAGDFTISTVGATTGATINTITPGGALPVDNYTVNITNINLDDASVNSSDIRLDILDNNTIVDNATNPLGGTGIQNFASGQTRTIIHPTPSGPVTSFAASSPSTSSITLTWQDPAAITQVPNRYLIIGSTSSGATLPTDNTEEAIDSDILDGLAQYYVNFQEVGIYDGGTSTYTYNFSGLQSGTTYHFQIIPNTNNGANILYNNTSVPEVSETTTTAALTTLFFNGAASTISSEANTQPDEVQSLNFRLIDDFSDNSADISPTLVNQFIFRRNTTFDAMGDWQDAIAGARLYDDEGNFVAGTINPNDITFDLSTEIDPGELGYIADNEAEFYSLRIWLNSSLGGTLPQTIDNSSIVIDLSNIIATDIRTETVGSSFLVASQSINSGNTNNSVTVIADNLNFTNEPVDIGVGSNFPTPLEVTAQDSNGNTDTDYSGTVSLGVTGSLSTFANAPTSFPTAPTTGVLVFPTNFNMSAAGTGTITVTDTDIIVPDPTAAASATFTASYSQATTISLGSYVSNTDLIPEPGFEPFIKIAEFDIIDDAGSPAINDAIPTLITSATITAGTGPDAITVNWDEIIEQAVLFDEVNFFPAALSEFSNGDITTNTMVFPTIDPTGTGLVPDNGTKTLSLFVLLKTTIGPNAAPVIDNDNLVFNINSANISLESESSVFNGVQSTQSNNTLNYFNITADRLSIVEQPTTTFINEIMNPAVTVEAIDGTGARDLDRTGTFDLNSTGSLASAVSVTLANGFGAASNIVHNAVGSNLELTVSDPLTVLATSASSNTFSIDPGNSESDITASSFTYTDNIDYAAFTGSLTNTFPKVFEIDINDGTSGAGATDSDVLATNVTSISFNITNSNQLAQIGFFDNSNVQIGAAVPSGATVTFNFASPLVIPDDGSEKYHLRASYNTTGIADNIQFDFTVSNVTTNDQGSQFEAVDGARTSQSAATSSVSGDNNRIEVTRTQLVFDNIAGASLNTNLPLITVRALDDLDNLDLDFNESLTDYSNLSTTPSIALTTINNPAGNFTSGVFTFPANFQFTEAGDGVTITIETSTFDGTPLPAAVSNLFNISSSDESNITLVTTATTPPATFEYVNFTANDIMGASNAYELARFSINDGGLDLTDDDGAATILNEITFSVTNEDNIRSIAIYDGTNEIQEISGGSASLNFNSLGIIANDNTAKEFIVYATFDPSNVIDGELQQITITNAVELGGSLFEFDQGGIVDGMGSETPVNTNIIDVVATEFAFVNPPISPTIEGLNVPLINPSLVRAQDVNGVTDFDIDEMFTTSSGLLTSGFTEITAPINLDIDGVLEFVNGELDGNAIRYAATGDGTLTISDVAARSISPAINTPTDVINTEITQLTKGIRSNIAALSTGATNVPIFGFELNANHTVATEPTLNSLVVQFRDLNGELFDINDIFENFRLFRSNDDSVAIADPLTNDIFIPAQIVDNAATGSVTINNLSEVIDNDLANQRFFLIANVALTAEIATPNQAPIIQPFIINTDISMSSGSTSTSDSGEIAGLAYTFQDQLNPEILSLNPIDGEPLAPNNNVSIATDLVITFNEPMVSDGTETIELIETNDTGSVLSLTVSSVNNDSTIFTFDPVDDLTENTDFFVRISANEFFDKSGNSFAGIDNATDWNFRTSDATAPVFITPLPIEAINQHADGFDLGVRIDEPGEVHYIVIESSEPDPVSASDIFDNATTYSGIISASGVINITIGGEYHYDIITGLSSADNYEVWAIARDESVPANNMIFADAEELSVDLSSFSTSSGTVLNNPIVEICVGEFQRLLSPITIREGENGDFIDGSDPEEIILALPPGFELNTSIPLNVEVTGGDIQFLSANVLSTNLFSIQYQIDGSPTGNLDYIIIRDLEIRASEAAVSGSITRIGGTANQVGNNSSSNSHATLSVTPVPLADFTFQLEDGTAISSIAFTDTTRLSLVPEPALTIEGLNIFSGDGVVGSNFFVGSVGLGDHDVTLTHTTLQGCQLKGTETITVFDNVSAIPGLSTQYCTGAGTIATINEFGRTGSTLLSLVADPILSTANLAGLQQVGNNYILDVDVAAETITDNDLEVTLEVTATYRDNIDFTVEQFSVPVVISSPPRLQTIELPDGPRNANEYCVDGTEIILNGVFDEDLQLNATHSFSFPSFPDLDDNISFSESNPSARIVPQEIVNEVVTIDNSYSMLWSVRNPNTGCESSLSTTFTINPLPEVGFDNTSACLGFPTEFTNTVSLPANDPSDPNEPIYTWNFDDLASGTPTSNDLNPSHTFSSIGFFDVSLEVETEKGCTQTASRNIQVGNNPTPNFTYQQIGVGVNTEFMVDETMINIAPTDVDTVVWSFANRDGSPNFEIGQSLISNPILYSFNTIGIKDVSLTIESVLGCATTLVDSLFIVPVEVLSDSTNYTAFFEDDSEGWVTWGANNSWIRSESGGNVITAASTSNGGSQFWVTGANNYNLNEESYVYSPIFNLTQLDRPLVTLDIFDHINQNDGAVLEYSTTGFGTTNNAEVSWTILGDLASGINWYDQRDIANAAGRVNDRNEGWSEEESDWKNARNTLSEVAGDSLVQFRIAFRSGGPDPRTSDGFAFDNFFIGQRTRTVLVENFTNINGNAAIINSEAAVLSDLANSATNSAELIVLNYHTDFPSENEINEANPVDPSARALFYNIDEVPRAVIDGNIFQDDLFSNWGVNSFELRTLALANFSIQINPTTQNGEIFIDATITPRILPLSGENITVTAAIVERTLGDLDFILRKLLPNAAGIRFATAGISQNVGFDVNFSWTPTNIADVSNMAVVIFIQDEQTKEIYQAEIVDLPSPEIVTSTDKVLNKSTFKMYPNPANEEVTILLSEDYLNSTLKIYDNFGKVVFEQSINQLNLSIDTQSLASGMYHIQLVNEKEIKRERLIIRHSDL